MAITGKVVTLERLSHFKEKTDEAYVAQVAGSQLVETADVTKLKGLENIKEVQVNGQKLTVGEDGIVNIDVEGVITGDNLVSDTELTEQLGAYTKTESLKDDPGIAGKYLDKETAGTTYATKAEITALGTIKGSCEKTELEDKKEGAKENDVWIVTDDNNHMYFYNGTDFVDTQAKAHVDLSNYYDKSTVDSTFAKTETVTGQLANKADKTELDNYVKAESLTECTDDDIDQLFTTE